MNINDYVYLYVFDLEKSLINMKKLRDDRFGRIVNKSILPNNNGNNVILYDIELFSNNTIIQYRTDNLVTNMVSINQLETMINNIDMEPDEKYELKNQIDDITNK